MLERMHPGVTHVQLDGGHAVPLEQPAVLGGLITAFAAEHGASSIRRPAASSSASTNWKRTVPTSAATSDGRIGTRAHELHGRDRERRRARDR